MAEAGVVGRDGEVTHQVQDVTAPDGVTRDLGNHRLGQSAYLNLEVQDVETPYPPARHVIIAHVAVIAADFLVATRAKGVTPGTGQDDGTHFDVVTGTLEGVGQLEERLGAKGVSPLGPVDRDARNPLGRLVDDVLVVAEDLPRGYWPTSKLIDWVVGGTRYNCRHHASTLPSFFGATLDIGLAP